MRPFARFIVQFACFGLVLAALAALGACADDDPKKGSAIGLGGSFGGGGGGGFGGGGGNTDTGPSGGVTLSISDAAVDNFSSFEMDVVEVVLINPRTRKEAKLYAGIIYDEEGNSSTPTLRPRTLNLLSLQGLADLFGSASIAADTYSVMRISYSAVRALDTDGGQQNLNVLDGGVFDYDSNDDGELVYYTASLRLKPQLTVTEGSTQALGLDFDLANSLMATNDSDTWNFGLAVAVTPATKPVPVAEFEARIVTQLDADALSITAAAKDAATGHFTGRDIKIVLGDAVHHYQTGDTFEHQSVRSQVELAKRLIAFWTGRSDIQLNWARERLSKMFPVGGYIKVEGSLLNGVIAASDVTNYAPGPDVVKLQGSIMSVDTDAGTVTVAVDKADGRNVEIEYLEEVEIATNGNTSMRRGATTLVTGDLSPYNYCNITANADFFGDLTATEVSVVPSYVAGTATNFSEGTGENDGDVITFTPSVVSLFRGDMLADRLDLLPATLNFEVFGETAEAGDSVKVMGFFSRSGEGVARLIRTYDYSGAGLKGLNDDSGAEQTIRCSWDPVPDYDNVEGGFTLEMVPEGAAGVAGATITAFFEGAGQCFFISEDGEISKPADGFEGLDQILTARPAAVIYGKPGDDDRFNARVLYLLDSADTSFDPSDTFTFSGVAAAEGDEAEATETTLTFALDTSDGGVLTINATDATQVRVYDETNTASDLSLEDAADLINGGGVEEIEVVSFRDADDGAVGSVVSISLVDHPNGMLAKPGNATLTGTVDTATDITVSGDGDIRFGLLDSTSGNVFDVTIASDADIVLLGSDGNGTELDLSLAVSVLQNSPFSVQVEGSAESDRGAFTADVAARISANPNTTRNTDYGNTLTGKRVENGVVLDADDTLFFDLLVVGPGGTPITVEVNVPAAATRELNTDGDIDELAPGEANDELAVHPDAFIQVTGAISFTGGASFTADVSLSISIGDGGVYIPQSHSLTGFVGYSGTIDLDGNLDGDLISLILDSNGSEFNVTVDELAEMVLKGPDGDSQSLDAEEALDALQATKPPLVIVTGSNPATADQTFFADQRLVICAGYATEQASVALSGVMADESEATLNSSGQIEFELAAMGEDGDTVEIAVFVAETAEMDLFSADGIEQSLSTYAALDALNTLDVTITVRGSSAPTADGFSADQSLCLYQKPDVDDFASGIAGGEASLDQDDETEFELDQPEGETLQVVVRSTAAIKFWYNNGDTAQYSTADLVDLINGDNDGRIDIGGRLSATRFTASYVDVFEAYDPSGGSGGSSSGATISGYIAGDAELDGEDIVFTMDFYDWFTDASGTLDVTVTESASYVVIDGDGSRNVSAEDAVDALNDSPVMVIVTGTGDYEGDGYEADVELQVYADLGQFGPNSHNGILAEGSTAEVNGDGDVEFELEVLDGAGTVFTISVTIDVGVAFVEFFDKYFVSSELTDAQVIASKINNDAGSIYVQSVNGQSGDVFVADSYVALNEIDTGGGTLGVLTGVMTPGTDADIDENGNLAFSLDMAGSDGGTLTVAVTVSASASFEIYDALGVTAADAEDAADSLNDFGDTSYLFVQGSLPFDGQTEYFADTYMSQSIFGQSAFLFGQPVSEASVNGDGDVEFNLETVNELDETITIAVTIDVGVAAVSHYDEFFNQTILESAEAIADAINNDTMDIDLASSTIQSGETFLADMTVNLYQGSLGGGEGFLTGSMTPSTTAYVDGDNGNLVFLLDTPNPFGGILTVTVTVSASAQYELAGLEGATLLDNAGEMADALNANPGAGFVFVNGTLPYQGETEYYADILMSLTLDTGTGGEFFYRGTVAESPAPTYDGQHIVFTMNVYDGSEGEIDPAQTVEVTADPAAFIQSYTETNGYEMQTDPNTIVTLLDSTPFEVEFAGSTQLMTDDTAYTVDATGFLTIFVEAFLGGGNHIITGVIEPGTATYHPDPEGDFITFTLYPDDSSAPYYDITVTDTAVLQYDDGAGAGIQTFASMSDAADYINANGGASIEVQGTSPPEDTVFQADAGLLVSVSAPSQQTETCQGIASNPSLEGDMLTFFLDVTEQTTEGAPPFGATIIVIVDVSLLTTFFVPDVGETQGPLTAAEAFDYLNATPLLVQVVGIYDGEATITCVTPEPPTSLFIYE